VAWALHWFTSATAFDLSARSEIVEISTGCHTQPRWVIRGARIAVDGGEQQGLSEFRGQIEVGPLATIRIERVGTGPLRVVVRAMPEPREGCSGADRSPLAVLVDAAAKGVGGARTVDPVERSVKRTLLLEAEPRADTPPTFSFIGQASVGQVVKSATRDEAPILVSGSLTLLGRSILQRWGSGLPYPVGSATLNPGDRFFVPKVEGAGFGFVRLDEAPGLLVGYRASGRAAEIDRFGTRGYTLGPSPWRSFAADPVMQLLYAALAALAVLLKVVSSLRRTGPSD